VGPCRGTAPPDGGYKHVVWIIEENESQSAISASNAPYMTGLARRCGLTTNLEAVTHPSLPNYLALTSGSTQGVTDDADPTSHPLRAPSIFSQLGENWTSLEDSMPSPCALASSGTYAVRHNPAAYFTNIRPACGTRDLPFNSSQTPDVSRAFTLITPDRCDDMHDCPVATGDAWLSAVVPKILDSATYRGGDTLLVITFDEGSSSDQTVWTAVVAPSVPPGTTSSASFTHYSTLRTTEELLGLPLLGAASSAPSFAADFHLR
jgi:phosphatidylinositol-3-phosphatase